MSPNLPKTSPKHDIVMTNGIDHSIDLDTNATSVGLYRLFTLSRQTTSCHALFPRLAFYTPRDFAIFLKTIFLFSMTDL